MIANSAKSKKCRVQSKEILSTSKRLKELRTTTLIFKSAEIFCRGAKLKITPAKHLTFIIISTYYKNE